MFKRRIVVIVSFVCVSLASLILVGVIAFDKFGVQKRTAKDTPVLGETTQTHFGSLISPLSDQSSQKNPTESTITTQVTNLYLEIVIADGPHEVDEGGVGTFSWYLTGSVPVVHMSTVYYGAVSTPGVLDKTVSPAATTYTGAVKDFLQGDYALPIRFTGNATFPVSGTFFYRGYTLVDGKHYWTEERSFTVRYSAQHSIKNVTFPSSLGVKENGLFSWEIWGTNATTGFSAIVGGIQSKPGTLGEDMRLADTPYTVLVSDFTNGTYTVPLKFHGHAAFAEVGTYYFRVLSTINGKNIWSGEYSLIVR